MKKKCRKNGNKRITVDVRVEYWTGFLEIFNIITHTYGYA